MIDASIDALTTGGFNPTIRLYPVRNTEIMINWNNFGILRMFKNNTKATTITPTWNPDTENIWEIPVILMFSINSFDISEDSPSIKDADKK